MAKRKPRITLADINNQSDTIKHDYEKILSTSVIDRIQTDDFNNKAFDSSLEAGAGYAINDDQITREIMSVQKITPDEIPTLYNEAVAIGKSFQTNIGTIPTTWVQALRMIPSIIKFFTESYPHIAVIVKEIKD